MMKNISAFSRRWLPLLTLVVVQRSVQARVDLRTSCGAGSAWDSSGWNPAGEGPGQAFDGTTSTKWLLGTWKANDGTDLGYSRGPTVITYDFGAPRYMDYYILYTANDEPGRDPSTWYVYGSNDNSVWTTVDSRSGQLFSYRQTAYAYYPASPGTFRYYQFHVTHLRGSVNVQTTSGAMTQLSEIQYQGGCSAPTAAPTRAPTNVPTIAPTLAPTTLILPQGGAGGKLSKRAKCYRRKYVLSLHFLQTYDSHNHFLLPMSRQPSGDPHFKTWNGTQYDFRTYVCVVFVCVCVFFYSFLTCQNYRFVLSPRSR